MFGRRNGGPVPKATRIVVGVIATLLGVLSIWMGTQAAAGRLANSEGPPWIATVFGVTMGGLGLMLVVGAFAGVGDNGERPASMRLATRLLIDAMGYLFGFGFAAMMAFAAIQSAQGGVILAAIGFGFFALVMAGLSTHALVRAVIRALRGEPYDDGAPAERQ